MLKKITIVLLSMLIILSICNISMAGGVFDDTGRFDTTVDADVEKTAKGFLGSAIDVAQIFSVGLALGALVSTKLVIVFCMVPEKAKPLL